MSKSNLPMIDYDLFVEYAKDYELWNRMEPPYITDPEHDAEMERQEKEMAIEEYGFVPPYMQAGLWCGVTTLMTECRYEGHKQLHDCSSAGPDSGDMDHICLHCGKYFSVPLY